MGMTMRTFGRCAALALLAAAPVMAGSLPASAAVAAPGALSVDRSEAHTGDLVTVSGADCLTADPEPAQAWLTAVDHTGTDLLGEPVVVDVAADGSWSWAFDAPAGTGTITLQASCVTYTGTEDYQPVDVQILGAPESEDGRMIVDRLVIREDESFTVSGTGCVTIPFEPTGTWTPFDRPGVWVMVSGHIDPSFVTPAADGTWSWTTTAPAPREGTAVTVSAWCHRGGGDEYDYADVSLPFEVRGTSVTVSSSMMVPRTSTSAPVTDTRRLSATGVDAATVGLGGLVLLVVGGAVVLAGRRRSSDHA